MEASKAVKGISLLFILAVPLFLISASVTWGINDLRVYSHGFDKFDIPARTGIEQADLMQVGREMRGYFNSTTEPLNVRTRINGQERSLFNFKEVSHMADVKSLVWGVYVLGAITGVFLLVTTTLGFVLKSAAFAPMVSRWALWGGGLTLGLIAGVGLAALVAFDQLFLAFHKVSFANDFWRLDPSRDYLVVIFPEGFWLDATLFVGLVAIGGALVLSAASGGYLLLARRRREGRELEPTVGETENAVQV
jgi:integral membrane protein (TIGR01906 family)